MKICYVGSPPLFSKGASAIHMMKMCQAMTRLGIDVQLVFPDYDKSKDIFDYYGITDRFRIKTIPFTNGFARQIVHGFTSSVYGLKNKKKYDLFLTRNIVFTYFATVWFGLPTVYDAHHPLVNGAARAMFNSFKNSPHLKKISTNSGGLAEIYLKEGLDKGKLVVAHNGVDTERFKIQKTPEELKNALGLPKDKQIVCYCGNTYRGRGIELLINAAERFPDVYFLVVGGLSEDNQIYESEVSKKGLNNFRITGFLPHSKVPEYLSASDVLVIPYTNEITLKDGTVASGFTSPIKLFEYMAAGKPILSSKLPTICEILEDGTTAVFFVPGDIDSFSDKLGLILNNQELCRNLSRNALSKVKEYTWEARVRKILESTFL